MSPKGRPEGESGPERVSAKGSPVSERRAGARVTPGVAEPPAVALPVAGPESRLPDNHHGALRLWLRLLTCTLMIERRIKSRLRERFDTTLPRFDLMAQLERAPGGLTMSELSRRLMVTGGNVTGLVDPLVAAGLVERLAVPGDRRAAAVRLTSRGRRAFLAMAGEHERWVIAMMAGVSERDRGELAALLARLKQSVTEHGGD
jgi:DNA-binding MarR family transcriptional regulator